MQPFRHIITCMSIALGRMDNSDLNERQPARRLQRGLNAGMLWVQVISIFVTLNLFQGPFLPMKHDLRGSMDAETSSA